MGRFWLCKGFALEIDYEDCATTDWRREHTLRRAQALEERGGDGLGSTRRETWAHGYGRSPAFVCPAEREIRDRRKAAPPDWPPHEVLAPYSRRRPVLPRFLRRINPRIDGPLWRPLRP